MRTLRGLLLTAAALAGIFPAAADAQQGRRFENAWFWGVKGGGMLYSHSTPGVDAGGQAVSQPAQNTNAPTVGIDWLITRSRGGLYASYDQGFLDETTAYCIDCQDPAAPIALVGLSNVRRVNLAGVFFPPVNRWVHPYVGAGLTFLQIADTEKLNREAYADDPQLEANIDATVTDDRTQLQPLAILGVQARFQPMSLFIQGTATQINERFLIRGGRTAMITYEIGVRYNIGSSIERL